MQVFNKIRINCAFGISIPALGLILLMTTCQRFDPEQLVLVKTGAVTEVIHDACKAEGEIYDTGAEGISQHGFCWSTSKNPVLETSEKKQLGITSSTGSFSSELEGLTHNTTYYLRAYATSNGETVYGGEATFTTTALSTPLVLTHEITGITIESAESGGEVSSDGGSAVTSRGVCWSTSENPTVEDAYTEDGLGMGSFSSSLTRLSCATVYYIRAYATNSEGTSYGDQLEFSTGDCPVGLPEVSTIPISGITEVEAQGGGEVSDEGSSSVSARGVCWSTEENPLISDDHTVNGGGTGSFVSSITGLSCGTVYYVRAYATNSAGTAYGPQEEFSTTDCPVSLSVVTTSQVTAITETTAQGGGNVTDDGGAIVRKKGICWSTSENPDLSDNYSESGGGTGSFLSSMTGLSCGTTFFVRAYATNSEGTSYGDQLEFKTKNCPVDPPTVTTAGITSITQGGAQGGGEVTDNGGAPVTAKGICWSTTQNPTTMDGHTEDGSGTGSFTSVMTGLECGITYYVRAYATNTGGTSYGSQEIFTTALCTSLPSVTTAEITDITDLTAKGGGDVTDDGNLPITARGVCWSTASGPVATDSKTEDGSGAGIFTSSLDGLSPNTEYFLRSYATNDKGTAYGEEMVFTTWEGRVTDYDGNVYGTVIIGEQTWMGSNLKVTRYSDGTAIPLVANKSEWDALEDWDRAYCWYDNLAAFGEVHGGLYNWSAVMNGSGSSNSNPSGVQGVCPDGWHVPSGVEWVEMEMYLGMSLEEAYNGGFRGTDEGGKLKETGFKHWDSPNYGATNESGFTALGSGARDSTGQFYAFRQNAFFWTTDGNGEMATFRSLELNVSTIETNGNFVGFGYSVRCVKDE